MGNINGAILIVEPARDETQALRHLIRSVAELRRFYVQQQRYRLDDEFLFEDKINEFKLAEHGRKLLLANEMEQIVLQCCFSEKDESTKGSNETSDLYWLLRDVSSLRNAVAQGDEKMSIPYLNNIWPEKFGDTPEENYFRRALAAVSGTSLPKLEQFEQHLLSVIACRRHLKWVGTKGQSEMAQLDELGLEEAKKYESVSQGIRT